MTKLVTARRPGGHRIVVKVGSSSLTSAAVGLDSVRLGALVDALAARVTAGDEVVLVSSGAIAAGLSPLGLTKRPRDLATLQAAASVGQGLLIDSYASAFGRAGLTVGQILLTADDIGRRAHYRNAHRTIERLLELRVVPIVNENDTVATEEIRFGDNDRIAALIAHLADADTLLLLSDVDGLYDGDPRRGGATLIHDVYGESELADVGLGGAGSSGVGSGGMATKVEAARIATAAGITVLLTSAANAAAALAGEKVGTRFHPTGERSSQRLLWLAHGSVPRGRLVLDPGAVAAVAERRLSLLPAGITSVAGDFVAGDPVDLCDEKGHIVARGLVNYDSRELPALLGRSTRELSATLGPAYEREVVHRDDLVLVRSPRA
ncbi:MAG: glutamate 5-kinase [Frankiaceae bacterium]|nr:glutamate 5-kinase [Frankiaceae bacterium]